ncbi:hypothetical protein, partial [Candidatus Villigracilis affinis]|uniref:hypothetical protein n=1 Tax=Candidatus Villigracilis affinis TaxID=3140682 RepID=UPI0031E9641A
MKTANWRETINVVLEGTAGNLLFACLFIPKTQRRSNQIVSSMIHEWTASGLETDLDRRVQNMPLTELDGIERLYKIWIA